MIKIIGAVCLGKKTGICDVFGQILRLPITRFSDVQRQIFPTKKDLLKLPSNRIVMFGIPSQSGAIFAYPSPLLIVVALPRGRFGTLPR